MSTDLAQRRAQLVALVCRLVSESGDIEGFEVERWVDHWLTTPLPAIGNRCPQEYLSTEHDYAILEKLLRQSESGAYW